MATRHSWLVTPMLFLLLLWATPSAAHMSMSEPPPINYKTNPNYNSAKGDFDYSAPLSPSGSNYPCKGHLKDLDAPEGRPVRTYAQGGTYNMVISGSAVHGGGSCQCALSYDKGKTFTVIKSFVGNCPHATPGGDQTFKFTIPKDAPSGNAVFAWTWFNNIGNREMYMNCASVTIGGTKKSRAVAKRAFSGPEVFKANIGNGCTTPAGTDVTFPNPGPNIEYGGNAGARALPVGNCQGGNSGAGGGSGSGGGSGGGSGTGTGTGTDTSGGSGSGSSSGTGTAGGDTSGAGTGTTGGGTQGSGNRGGEASVTFISSSRRGATGTATRRASSSGAKKSSKTVARPQSFTSLDTPAHTGGGGAGGDVVVSTVNPATQTGDGAVETNIAGGDSGPSSVQDTQGCAYWRSQGYVCSGASKSLLGRRELLQMFGGVLLVLAISGL